MRLKGSWMGWVWGCNGWSSEAGVGVLGVAEEAGAGRQGLEGLGRPEQMAAEETSVGEAGANRDELIL